MIRRLRLKMRGRRCGGGEGERKKEQEECRCGECNDGALHAPLRVDVLLFAHMVGMVVIQQGTVPNVLWHGDRQPTGNCHCLH